MAARRNYIDDYAAYDVAAVRRERLQQRQDGRFDVALSVPALHCGGCVARCETLLNTLPGVDEVRINLTTRRAALIWQPRALRFTALLAALDRGGFAARPYDPRRREIGLRDERRSMLQRLAVAGLGAMQVMMFSVALYAGEDFDLDIDEASRQLLRWACALVSLPVVGYAARPFFRHAWAGLRRRRLVMDLPVALAIGGAFAASVWATWSGDAEARVYFDSVCMFTFLLLLGRFLEFDARRRAASAADELDRMIPASAERVDADGSARTVAVAELAVGDRVRVRPGATVPADGRVIDGVSSVDEALLSGESLPVAKGPGAEVTGGSVNVESPLLVRVERLGDDTVMASISRLLAQAQRQKPRLAALADRVAGGFVGALLLAAAAVYLYWAGQGSPDALQITLAVLVVTCPCALSLATPAALTAATGAFARCGLLVCRGHALETLARCDRVLFDKTGTLSHGRPTLTRIETCGRLGERRCLQIAAALERHSEHPLAGVLAAAEPGAAAVEVIASPGRGVEGVIDGRRYRIGSVDFVTEFAGSTATPPDRGAATLAALADQSGLLALFHFHDAPRAEAAAAVAALQRLGLRCEILSGDRPAAVAATAAALGLTRHRGGVCPQQKLARLEQLQRDGETVAAVGDGINDSPLLARAQVSVAMANGTDLARASADLVLLGERLDALPVGVRIARRTLRIVRQNFAWAIGYNLLALPLAAAGYVSPWMAALGMSASSLVVVLNALRIGPPAAGAALDTAVG